MHPWFRRLALCLVLVAASARAAPHREDRRIARARPPAVTRVDPADADPAQAPPITAADVGGVDLAGLLGMLTAVAATVVYARGRRAPARARAPGSPR